SRFPENYGAFVQKTELVPELLATVSDLLDDFRPTDLQGRDRYDRDLRPVYIRLTARIEEWTKLKIEIDQMAKQFGDIHSRCMSFIHHINQGQISEMRGWGAAISEWIDILEESVQFEAGPSVGSKAARSVCVHQVHDASSVGSTVSIGGADASQLEAHCRHLADVLARCTESAGAYDTDDSADLKVLQLHFGIMGSIFGIDLHGGLYGDEADPLGSVIQARERRHLQCQSTVFLHRGHTDRSEYYEARDRARLLDERGCRTISFFPEDISDSTRLAVAKFLNDGFEIIQAIALQKRLPPIQISALKARKLIQHFLDKGQYFSGQGGSHGRLVAPFAMPVQFHSMHSRAFNDVYLAAYLVSLLRI
ncbi:hypothetical protein EBR96_08790, partial [bacterium]|nr:hypothetical protein [bacterium]